MTDYYLNNPDHPLANSFSILDEWSTSLGLINFNLPDEIRLGLIKCIAKKTYQRIYPSTKNQSDNTPDNPNSTYTSKHHYNLFASSSDDKSIIRYKEIITELIRFYVANSWSVENVTDLKIEAKCFGNVQSWGQRTYPHYHHGYDGVAITYLTLGDEFTVDRDCMENDNWEDFLINVSKPKEEDTVESFDLLDMVKQQTPAAPNTHPENFEKQGNLILLDPRPAISYPYNMKARSLIPKVGTSLFHPGYLWHESNPFTGAGIRVGIVVNFNIGTSKSPEPLTVL